VTGCMPLRPLKRISLRAEAGVIMGPLPDIAKVSKLADDTIGFDWTTLMV